MPFRAPRGGGRSPSCASLQVPRQSFFSWSPRARAKAEEDSRRLLRRPTDVEVAQETELPHGPNPTRRCWLSCRSIDPVEMPHTAQREVCRTPSEAEKSLSPWWCSKVCLVISSLLLLDFVLMSVICWSKLYVSESTMTTLTRRQDAMRARREHYRSVPAAELRAVQAPVGILARPMDLPAELRASLNRPMPKRCTNTAMVVQTTRDTNERWMRRAGLHLEGLLNPAEASTVSVRSAWVGARVRRGRDWKQEYGDQDGGRGNSGTVKSVGTLAAGLCSVQWDNGQDGTYRAGKEGKFELEFLPDAQAGLPELNLTRGVGVEGLRTPGFGLDLTAKSAFLAEVPEVTDELVQRFFGTSGLRYSVGVMDGLNTSSTSSKVFRDLLAKAEMQLEERGETLQLVNNSAVPVKEERESSSQEGGQRRLQADPDGPGSEKELWHSAEFLAFRLLSGLGRARPESSEAWTDPEHERQLHDGQGLPLATLVSLDRTRAWTQLKALPAYYLVGQLSKYVPAGSRRIEGSVGPSTPLSGVDRVCEGFHAAAFRRPDAQLAVVALNCGARETALELRRGPQSARTRIPPHTMQTLLLEDAECNSI